ncbi:MAG: LysM peptidoglycan-binding domain-containing protein [Planctomycetia bacterium]|nr:LysM peptidoglycan-binding domain-containing protein [Planctomycetia bacterium]
MTRMIQSFHPTRTTNRTRETTILLSILGLLFIAFSAVLTLKLAAPRPPMGSGPDVHLAQSHSSGHTLVEPPSLPPSVPKDISLERSTSRFSTPLATVPSSLDNQEPVPSVDAPYDRSAPEIPEVPDVIRTSLGLPEVSSGDISNQPSVFEPAESWWSLAERHYGDGRFYKALYAWNRTTNPRVTLAHGKDIEIPSKLDLEYAWPALLPREPLLSSENKSDSTHTVKDGDTLMSIARSRLGSSDQWRLLYDTNRRSLGNQPGPLAPGVVLTLPTNEFVRQSSQ